MLSAFGIILIIVFTPFSVGAARIRPIDWGQGKPFFLPPDNTEQFICRGSHITRVMNSCEMHSEIIHHITFCIFFFGGAKEEGETRIRAKCVLS